MRRLQSYSALPAGGREDALSPLAKKLRFKHEHTVLILNSPPAYLALLDPGPAQIEVELKPDRVYDAVQLFVNNADELHSLGSGAVHATKPDGLLWVCYPKGGKTAGGTDLPATPWWTKRDVLGEITGEKGYKPVTFVKIDETWTALRFKRS